MSVILPTASSTVAGVASTGTQTIAGAKTFTGAIDANGGWTADANAYATGSVPGLVSATTQTIGGAKTLAADLTVSTSVATGTGGTSISLTNTSTSSTVKLRAGTGNDSPALSVSTADDLVFTYSGTTESVRVKGNGAGVIIQGNNATNPSTLLKVTNNAAGGNTINISPSNTASSSTITLSNADDFNFGTTSGTIINMKGGGGATSVHFPLYANGTMSFTGGNGTISSSSDSRLKTEVQRPGYGLSEILRLTPRFYTWNEEVELRGADADVHLGFFAQEVGNVMREAAPHPVDPNGYYGMYDRPLIAALVQAVKELNTKNTELEERLAALEAR